MDTALKSRLHARCLDVVEERIATLRQREKEVQTAANSETKSSAGDKYETGRAMMQLDRERLAGQMEEAAKLKKALDQVALGEASQEVVFGSLVITSGPGYFIAASLGEVALDENKYFVISASAPIAGQLMGKQVGETIQLAGRSLSINEIH